MSRSLLVAALGVMLACLLGSDARGSTALRANGRIAFSAVGGIASMNPDGSGQWGVELNVGDSWWVGRPAWSPDGGKLAFPAAPTTNTGTHLYVLDFGSGKVAQLSPDTGYDDWPTWSPDGTQVAFVSARNGTEQVYAMNADG